MAVARILIYTATAGYRHDSIPTAVDALQSRAAQHNLKFDTTEDKSFFTDNNLVQYDAIAFVLNSDEVLDQDGKAALQTYLNNGGNYVGIHSASACLFTTSFYQRAVGALFDYHPVLQTATLTVVDATHPSTRMLPERWTFVEEVYNFRGDPRDVGAKVLLSVDESSYIDDHVTNYTHGVPHPIAWYQERLAGASTDRPIGRSWYTSLGHLSSTWQDETFLAHVFGGIKWALASNTTRAFNPDGRVGNIGNPASAVGSEAPDATGSAQNDPAQKAAPPVLAAGTVAAAVSLAQSALL